MTKKHDPDTIRACIAAIMELGYIKALGMSSCTAIRRDDVIRALEALLPDPAQELVGEFCKTSGYITSPPFNDFARWLLENYEVKRK